MDTSLVSAVVTGVLIFVGGQYLLKLVLEPVVEIRRTIGELGSILSVHHGVLTVPTRYCNQQRTEVAVKIELISGKLFGSVMALPGYGYLRRLFGLPSKTDVLEVVDRLQSIVGISESEASWMLEKNWRLTLEVFELLRAPIPMRLQTDTASLLRDEMGKREEA